MNKFIKLLIIIFLIFQSYGKNLVKINTDIISFIEHFKNNNENVYRTGLLKGKNELYNNVIHKTYDLSNFYFKNEDAYIKKIFNEFENKDVNNKKYFAKMINHNEITTYKVIYPNISKEISSFYKSNLQKTDNCKEIISDKGKTWRIRYPFKDNVHPQEIIWHNPPNLTKKELIKKAVEIIREQLPKFQGLVEYQTYEIEYEAIRGEKVITMLSVRLRRIFKGGIVTRNISYIYVTLDGWGNLYEIRIRWPIFVERKLLRNDELISITTAHKKALKISEDMPQYKFNTGEYVSVKDVNLTGMACTWALLDGKYDSNIIVPSFSYIQKITLENDFTFYKYLDIHLLNN